MVAPRSGDMVVSSPLLGKVSFAKVISSSVRLATL